MPAQPVQGLGELYGDAQALAAGYVQLADLPGLGRAQLPGPGFHVGLAPDRPLAAEGRAPPGLPLAGVKILDLGNFLAGPLVPMLLGDLGADVIKLEATNGDPMRSVEWAFNGCQRSKRSIALQLKDAASKPVIHALIGWADIVHHNQRLPAAHKLGFGWEAVHARNPAAIYSHVSSYGHTGPRRDWPGYDQLFQAASGWEQEGAGAGNPPMWHRFGMMDHLGAMASVVATLAALVRRNRSGTGEQVAASLLGASVATLDVIGIDGGLTPHSVLNSQQMGIGPTQRLLRTADGWVALSAPGEAAIARLAALAADAAAWAQSQDSADVLAALAAARLPAEQVRLDNRDAYFSDPANRSARLVINTPHPVYGDFQTIGAAWGFGDLVLPPRPAAAAAGPAHRPDPRRTRLRCGGSIPVVRSRRGRWQRIIAGSGRGHGLHHRCHRSMPADVRDQRLCLGDGLRRRATPGDMLVGANQQCCFGVKRRVAGNIKPNHFERQARCKRGGNDYIGTLTAKTQQCEPWPSWSSMLLPSAGHAGQPTPPPYVVGTYSNSGRVETLSLASPAK